MNKVDLLVRELLFTYPTLFRNRLDALLNIFGNSGYEWDDHGCIVSVFPNERDTSVMDYSDLDRDDEKLASEDRDIECLRGLTALRVFEAKKARMERELIAANIDIVASKMPSGASVPYERLNNLSLYSLDDEPSWRPAIPFGSMDADWLAAAEELIDVFRYSFNRIFSLHYDQPVRGEKAPEPSMFSRMPLHFQKLYTTICAIDDKLNAQSGRRERAKAMMASIDIASLLAEIKAEDEAAV